MRAKDWQQVYAHMQIWTVPLPFATVNGTVAMALRHGCANMVSLQFALTSHAFDIPQAFSAAAGRRSISVTSSSRLPSTRQSHNGRTPTYSP